MKHRLGFNTHLGIIRSANELHGMVTARIHIPLLSRAMAENCAGRRKTDKTLSFGTPSLRLSFVVSAMGWMNCNGRKKTLKRLKSPSRPAKV
jgi:hypothetical protein